MYNRAKTTTPAYNVITSACGRFAGCNTALRLPIRNHADQQAPLLCRSAQQSLPLLHNDNNIDNNIDITPLGEHRPLQRLQPRVGIDRLPVLAEWKDDSHPSERCRHRQFELRRDTDSGATDRLDRPIDSDFLNFQLAQHNLATHEYDSVPKASTTPATTSLTTDLWVTQYIWNISKITISTPKQDLFLLTETLLTITKVAWQSQPGAPSHNPNVSFGPAFVTGLERKREPTTRVTPTSSSSTTWAARPGDPPWNVVEPAL